ncbi:MAG TPA: DUF1553 domain-containing protein [Urbifossiella sp.]|nr:DUF1553 domain-containing protein [Urbifossiella sp.]
MTRLVALALLLVPAAARADDAPSYDRHVAALFSRLGCNGGACHGAVRGQNGFRLSLFGADPAGDRERLLREFGGRRLNVADPAASLLLRKATGEAEHGGGVRLRPGSAEYDVLRRWIAAGAPADAPSRVTALRVTPAEHVAKPGDDYALKVQATFADGRTEDVTAYCSFESQDRAAATVDAAGRVTAKSAGEAALVVRYRAEPALARVLVPRPAAGPFPDVPANNFIDTHVLARLRQLNLPPADLADDATFLRRAHLDVTGELPTPDEVRAFLADTAADKRAKKIDELLRRPGHAALWTLRFCDLLKAADFGVYADALTLEADAPRFQAWVRARLEANTPYDVFVERVLTATSRDGRTAAEYAAEVEALFEGYRPGRPDLELYRNRRTLDLYWQRRGADGVGGAMQVAHSFLGLRLECAQCHRHPHDVWQQDDLLQFANFFTRVRKVGFQGGNEKLFPDTAEQQKRYDAEGKRLEAVAKQRKEGDGKRLDELAKAAKADLDKLGKRPADVLANHKAVMAMADDFRRETQELEKKAKRMPEVARRLMHAEVRLLPTAKAASVTSPLGTREAAGLRLPGAAEVLELPADADPRAAVVAWMRRPDNPYFARAIVNRVWAHYFGRGLVDPPDNLSAFNPATHPALLKELCDGFVANKYDLRWLHRTILLSRTYQQSSTPRPEASADRANYAAFPLRRLPAEVFLDALSAATGVAEKMDMQFHHWPADMKTVEVPFAPRNPFVVFVLEQYGRPTRNAAVQCDCERDGGASVLQVLTLANHPQVWLKIRDPNGRVAKLAKAPVADKVEELFLAVLGRLPSAAERAACAEYVRTAPTPEAGLHGVLWGLLNTREFVLQH